MKDILTFSIATVLLSLPRSEVIAQGGKPETLHGFVEAVDGNKVTVNYRRKDRDFTINDQAKILYDGFIKAKKEIKPGFVIRAQVDGKGRCNQLWVTPPIPKEPFNPSPEMLKMTSAELYKRADSDGDGELSYVEFATAYYRSPKHGPWGFPRLIETSPAP